MRGKDKSKNPVMNNLQKAVKNRSLKGIHPNAISKHVANLEEINNTTSKNLRSNLEGKNLDEFLDLAKLSHKQYEVLNEQVVLQTLNTNMNREIHQNQFSGVFLKNALKNTDIKLYETKPLAIPKRPKWKKGISALEFDRMERESFLNWRRALAKEEESNTQYSITPYEKNIEVWRQLWLVVDKCQLLIQIVDGRNPLYFYCPDLEKYISEVDDKKSYILLINKADLMNDKVRKNWADYLNEKGIRYVFFSALAEEKKMEEEIEKLIKVENKEKDSDDEDNDASQDESEDEEPKNTFNQFKNLSIKRDVEEDEDETTQTKPKPKELQEDKDQPEVLSEESETEVVENELNIQEEALFTKQDNTPIDESIRIYNRDELIQLVEGITEQKERNQITKCYYVGFIGYPNVGKSSVINVLMMKKKVGVACMPGKTKHYQTLFLPNKSDFCLMDCPGLVFPSFTSSRGDMAVNGIIPIDTLREFHSPIAIIIQKIPRKVLEAFYKIELPDIYSATQFLQVLATNRGFFTGRSLPDEARTAKWVLKDYVSGKLLFCNLRPDYDEAKHGRITSYDIELIDEEEVNAEEEREKMQIIKEIPADFDDDFDKINIDTDTTRNLKIMTENFDSKYFNQIMDKEDNENSMKDRVMNKDMKRQLKFALKRGEISEEDYESAVTIEDFDNIVLRINQQRGDNKKDLVGTKIIQIK
jgi:large subunit GTPase 1